MRSPRLAMCAAIFKLSELYWFWRSELGLLIIPQHQVKGSMPSFFKSYWPISRPYPQDDFGVLMDQRLPDENPWYLNCHI